MYLINSQRFGFESEKSMLFDGVNEHLDITSSVSTYSFIERTNIFVVSIWFRLIDFTADDVPVITGNHAGTTAKKGFSISFENRVSEGSPKYLTFVSTRGVGGQEVARMTSANDIITDNNWHHLLCTSDNTTNHMYLDNVDLTLATDTIGTLSTGDSTHDLQFAAAGNNSFPSNLHIDEPAIFDINFDSGEVGEVWNSGCPGDLKTHSLFGNMISHYHMGDLDDTITTIIDRGSAGKDGTPANAELGDIITDVPTC